MVGADNVAAQQVSKVYPRYVVAGQEARFVAEGQGFPADAPAALGMKFVISPERFCEGATRYQPVSATRYYFACTIGNANGSVKLRVYNRENARTSTTLWEGRVQVLPVEPAVESVTVLSERVTGQTSVGCPAGPTCMTVVGELAIGVPLVMEVRGSNLPQSLTLDFAGCETPSIASDESNTTYRKLVCTPTLPGILIVRLRTAPLEEGGKELITDRISVSAAAAQGSRPAGAAIAPGASNPR